jgi:hypothetical protein
VHVGTTGATTSLWIIPTPANSLRIGGTKRMAINRASDCFSCANHVRWTCRHAVIRDEKTLIFMALRRSTEFWPFRAKLGMRKRAKC